VDLAGPTAVESLGEPMNFFGAVHQARRAIARSEAARAGEAFYHALQGVKAFEAGLSPADCSYILDTPEQRAWIGGWFAAHDRRFFNDTRPLPI